MLMQDVWIPSPNSVIRPFGRLRDLDKVGEFVELHQP